MSDRVYHRWMVHLILVLMSILETQQKEDIMKVKTALNHRDRFIRWVNDMFRNAERFGWNSDRLLQERSERILHDPAWERCPRWVHEYVNGYYHCHWDLLWKKVIWVHPWKGVLYNSWLDLPPEGQEYYKEKDHVGFHVWKNNQKKHYTGTADQYNTGL